MRSRSRFPRRNWHAVRGGPSGSSRMLNCSHLWIYLHKGKHGILYLESCWELMPLLCTSSKFWSGTLILKLSKCNENWLCMSHCCATKTESSSVTVEFSVTSANVHFVRFCCSMPKCNLRNLVQVNNQNVISISLTFNHTTPASYSGCYGLFRVKLCLYNYRKLFSQQLFA